MDRKGQVNKYNHSEIMDFKDLANKAQNAINMTCPSGPDFSRLDSKNVISSVNHWTV